MAEDTEQKHRDYTGVIIAAVLIPVVLFFIWIGKEDMGRSVAICLGVVLLAVRIRWDLRKCVWFQGILVFLGVVYPDGKMDPAPGKIQVLASSLTGKQENLRKVGLMS